MPRVKLVAAGLLVLASPLCVTPAAAVYGDIAFQRSAATAKQVEEGPAEDRVPPAVFPHWVHRIRFRCMACHPTVFEMEQGANAVTMANMKKGEFCGACHNGRIAFSPELKSCNRCHVVEQPTEPLQEEETDPVAEAAAGKVVYEKWCASCHGNAGRGDGPAAPFLDPKPRDFFNGAFKIRTTQSGELPLDEDVLKVIEEGMPGSSMPAWRGLISRKEGKQIIAHIKTLMEEGLDEYWPPETVTIGEAVPATAESIAMGKELFTKMKCWECHGEKGKGDGPSAPKLKDDWGYSIKATNLTQSWNFRGGGTATDIFRTFTTGLNGTPMPSYMDVLADEDRWHLANFVKSLSPEARPRPKTFWEWTSDPE